MEKKDYKFMRLAFDLAKKGVGGVNPNPLVGAVIVKNDVVIAQGYHALYGGPHAEINAFADAKQSVRGACIYVSLEPCSHFGKTPPCAQAIIDKGIARVVIGMLDPNVLVAGRGVKMLEDAGIEVSYAFMLDELEELNRVFLKYISTKLPYVVMKTAMTLDGKIACHTGDSRWVSNASSRERVHLMRNELMAIMVGVNTVIADDPMLTCRLEGVDTRNPIRVVVDSKGRIPLDSKLLNTNDDARTIIALTDQADDARIESIRALGAEVIIVDTYNDRVCLKSLMQKLGEMGIDGILLEGGASLNFSALEAGIVDEVVSFIAPKFVGGQNAKTPVGGNGIDKMSDAICLSDVRLSTCNGDIVVQARIKK